MRKKVERVIRDFIFPFSVKKGGSKGSMRCRLGNRLTQLENSCRYDFDW